MTQNIRKLLYETFYSANPENSSMYKYLKTNVFTRPEEEKFIRKIMSGGNIISFVPHYKDYPLIGKDNEGKQYGRSTVDEAIQIISNHIRRSGDDDENKYWIDIVIDGYNIKQQTIAVLDSYGKRLL